MDAGRFAANASRIALVVCGMLATAVGCILLFMLGLTTDDHLSTAGATIGLHVRLPLTISSVSYLVMIPVLPLTLIRRLAPLLGVLAIGLSVVGLVAGLMLWAWNPYLDWRWPTGLLFASAIPLLAGAGAVHREEGWAWPAGRAALGLILLGAAVLHMNLLRG
jgi:hypothetical protein